MNGFTDTIIAPATPQGQSALAVIRLSGDKSFEIGDNIFKGASLAEAASHTIHYGWISDGDKDIDEVMVSVFRAPRTFTTEDSIEISCHGSPQIVKEILDLAIKNGARLANPGEFTLRAFLHGRLDLSQAEAIADLIHATSAKSSEIALKQLKGHFSSRLKELRQELIDFAALVELELDFSEEDVEFAHRGQLRALIHQIINVINPLVESFKYGNSVREGIPVAIIGPPNAGKSTLLNTILNEDKALVSDIAGTTRDVIEDILVIDGIAFRFIDTAGIRQTSDTLEGLGIERSIQKLKAAEIVFYLHDIRKETSAIWEDFQSLEIDPDTQVVILLNKADCVTTEIAEEKIASIRHLSKNPTFYIIARSASSLKPIFDYLRLYTEHYHMAEGTILTNTRHVEALNMTKLSLERVLEGMDNNLSSDLIAMDIREGLHHLGSITGEVSSDDLLESIFSKFCIGK
ncbi:MAG: tRNA uridine-5-carboxymethylaminomethyl(34) synthesis GTPase MnmE [Chitinophagales bacterium]|nr:tRNA uridine-5-carboxymethylaminomethyl(34) synthesis GTPase MnmE [Chitinophagales bacterium]